MNKKDYSKFRRKLMNAATYQQDLKPPIMVHPDCFKCKRAMADHPSYPRTTYPVYGTECVYPYVDRYP
jgi:hypothetical protein